MLDFGGERGGGRCTSCYVSFLNGIAKYRNFTVREAAAYILILFMHFRPNNYNFKNVNNMASWWEME